MSNSNPSSPTVQKKKGSPFKGFSILKSTTDLTKNVARKLGKSASQDSSAVITRHQYIEHLNDQLPKVARGFRKESEAIGELTDHQKHLVEQTTIFNQILLKHKSESENHQNITSSFVETIQSHFVQLHHDLQVLENNLLRSLLEETCNPLVALSKNDIGRAKEQYRKWESSRHNYEEAQKKFESAKKDKNAKDNRIKELEAECNSTKAMFENCDRDTMLLLHNTTERVEYEYMAKVRTVYLEAYKKYFEQGHDLINKIIAQVPEPPQPVLQVPTGIPQEEPDTDDNDDNMLDSDDEGTMHDVNIHDDKKKSADWISATYEVQNAGQPEQAVTVDFSDLIEKKPEATCTTTENAPSTPAATGESQDVGSLLQSIMEKENQLLEEQILSFNMQKQEEETKQKQLAAKKLDFDTTIQLKHGSPFHTFLVHAMNGVINEIRSQLKDTHVPPSDETFDAGKPLGNIQFGLGDILLAKVDIPKQHANVSFTEQTITIVWNEVAADMDQFEWYYKKETFPKLKDNGLADAGMSKGIICVTLTFELQEGLPKASVLSTAVKIGHIEVKISGTNKSFIYNVLLSSFSKSMKTHVQEQLQKVVNTIFVSKIDQIMNSFVEQHAQ